MAEPMKLGIVVPGTKPTSKFNPNGQDYDYDRAISSGMGPAASGPNAGHWGSVAPVTTQEMATHGLPEGSSIMLKGSLHPTWDKAIAAENARGSNIQKRGDRYFSVPQPSNKQLFELLDSLKSEQNSNLTVSIDNAVKSNSDVAAADQKLSSEIGLPPDVVARNREKIHQDLRAARIKEIADNGMNPALKKLFADPEFAKIAHPDADGLSVVEQSARAIKAVGSGAVGSLLGGGIKGFGSIINDLAYFQTGDKNLKLGSPIYEVGQSIEDFSKKYLRPSGNLNKIEQVAEGVGQAGGQVALWLASPAAKVTSLSLMLGQGATAMEEMIKNDPVSRTASEVDKAAQRLTGAAITAVTNTLATKFFISAPQTLALSNKWLHHSITVGLGAGVEGITELAENVLHDMAGAMTNPESKIKWAEAQDAGEIGAYVGAIVQSIANAALHIKANKQKSEFERLQTAGGEQGLKQKSPDAYNKFSDSVAAHMANTTDGPITDVYIDRNTFKQALTDNKIDPVEVGKAIPSIGAQVDSVDVGGDIVIPMNDWIGKVVGTDIGAMLSPHARGSVDAPSLSEVQQATAMQPEMSEQILAAIAKKQTNDAFVKSSHEVQDIMFQQLKQTGRYADPISRINAQFVRDFVVTQAANQNMMPMDFFNKYMYKVTAEGQAAFNQERIDMHYKDVTKRIEGLTAAANQLKNGEITAADYDKLVNQLKPVAPYESAPTPTSLDDMKSAITTDKVDKIGAAYKTLSKGDEVGLRLDIPSYRDHGAWIVAIHNKRSNIGKGTAGKAIGYDNVASITDAVFGNEEKASLNIAAGKGKATIATIEGKWNPVTQEQAHTKVTEVFNNPEWIQVGMDPERHSYFYDRKTMEPVVSADEVIQIGPLVMARNPVYAPKSGFLYQSLSTRLPSSAKATEDPMSSVLNINFDVTMSDEVTLAKNLKALQSTANFRKLTGAGARDVKKNVESIIDHMVSNLLFLHDSFPAEMRERAELWYDGGRKTTEEWANRYGISEMQAAAAIAVLSPQNGWFANVSSAERVADIIFGMQSFVWDSAMTEEANKIPQEKPEDKARMKMAEGKSLGEVLNDPEIAARWIRVFDQTHNNRSYRILTPEGGVSDYVTIKDGSDATMAWKSFGAIAKAVSILTEGTASNTYYQIGKEHKVRNFYNNLFAPNSPLGFATIDTHAVAAANLRPLAANDDEVTQAFGGAGSSSSSNTGLNGTYPIIHEAYKRAAEARGILPRQMQSITWEAARGLFESSKKSGMKAAANAIWSRYKSGEIDQEQAQKEIFTLAGGVTPPSWSSVPFNDTVGRTYEGVAQKAIDAIGNVGAKPNPVNVLYEVAPDPNDAELTDAWNALSQDDKFRISQEVSAAIIPKILEEIGSSGKVSATIGGYLGATNPSLSLSVDRKELAVIAAKLIGHALSQDAMVVVSEQQITGTSAVGAVSIGLPEGYGEREIAAMYDKLWELEKDGKKLVNGYTAQDGYMVILNQSGLSNEEFASTIHNHIGPEFEVDGLNVFSALIDKKDYGYDTENEPATAGRASVEKRNDRFREEANSLLRESIAEIGTRGTGNGSGKYSSGGLAPLEGGPVRGEDTSPDIKLVRVAEQYAAANGIDLKRQSEYAQVDPARAARIADAYAEMKHDPQDPVVAEAYQNMIKQTRAQYQALVDAGYEFYFYDNTNDPYAGNPWNAMRDLRANQRMGVYSTEAGFGSGDTAGTVDQNVSNNPLLEDTGLVWMFDGKPRKVLANDLFRAVHDAFGHGLEGAGFRAAGEENAWQAHVRLFTGSAVAALTSETRGQNSWTNFGPHGEHNRTAKVEDTIFADQKTGLLPEFALTEGRVGDQQTTPEARPSNLLRQPVQGQEDARGGFDPTTLTTILGTEADNSTFLHETAHFFLSVYADMAANPNATEQSKQDMQTVLDWFGVKDLATWNQMSLDEQRKYHEQFAYNYEIYLFEGKAPNIKLQTIFDRFSAWLARVYKSIRDDLNAIYRQEHGTDLPILTGEVRQVMDRMLATSEQIKQTETVRNMVPIFQTQEQSGMDDSEWAAYQEMSQEATNAAIGEMQTASLRQMKWLSGARSRVLKEMQKETAEIRKSLRDKVVNEVMADPVYRAITWIRSGETVGADGSIFRVDGGHLLSFNALTDMYGDAAEFAVPGFAPVSGMFDWSGLKSKKLVTGKGTLHDGIHPDIVAEMFGFKSGDDLVRALVSARKFNDEVNVRTDERMLAEHAELQDPKSIEVAVESAIHNEARARFVSVELRHLAKATAPVRVMLEAARQAAVAILASRPIGTIKPKNYSIAEARAAQEAINALKKGDTAGAMEAKRNQLLNNQLASEAIKVNRSVAKSLDLFKKVFTADSRIADKRDMNLVSAARAILANYGLGKTELPAGAYLAKVQEYDPEFYAEIEPMITAHLQQAKPITELTTDQFTDLSEQIQALWHLSRRNKQMEIDGKMVDRNLIISELVDRIDVVDTKKERRGYDKAMSDWDKRKIMLMGARAAMRRVESWVDAMDGGRLDGPFRKYIWNPISESVAEYRIAKNEYLQKYLDIVKSVEKGLSAGSIAAGEIGYTFKNKAELLHAILHTGNESNKRKMLLGRGWAEENQDGSLNTARWDNFMSRMYAENRLSKVDFDFAQSVWDLLEEMKPAAQKVHKDMYGFYFNEISANPVITPFGIYRGGYVPAVTDPWINTDAAMRNEQETGQTDNSYMFPTTGRGFTKGRVEYNKPLMLDLGYFPSHLDKVLRFTYIEPKIKDVAKIVKTSQTFSAAMDRLDPTIRGDMLVPWLQRTAMQMIKTPMKGAGGKLADKFFSEVRTRTGMQMMVGNVTNALQQVTGLSIGALKVKPGNLRNALWLYTRQPTDTSTMVAEKSKYMNTRMSNQQFEISKTIDELLLNPSKYDKLRSFAGKHGYFMQQGLQNAVDTIVWVGAYNQSMTETGNERDAVRAADSAVRLTQGSFSPEDVSRFETGTAFVRAFTMFYSYFNMQANLLGTEFTKTVKEFGVKKGMGQLLYIYTFAFMIPAVLSEIIVQGAGGFADGDDDEWDENDAMALFFGSQARTAIAMIPIVGPSIMAGVNAWNSKPYDDRISTSASISALESTVRAPNTLYKAIAEDGSWKKAIRDTLTALGMITGLPLGQMGKPLGYAADMAQGRVSPEGVMDVTRGVISGKDVNRPNQ
jgi:hypothetical protein